MSQNRKPEIALKRLQSLVAHFQCGICKDTLDDVHILPACRHRFCGKCILVDGKRGLKCGNKCPSCSHPILNRYQILRDTEYEQVIKGVQDAVNHLQDFVASAKEEEDAIDAAFEEANRCGTWFSSFREEENSGGMDTESDANEDDSGNNAGDKVLENEGKKLQIETNEMNELTLENEKQEIDIDKAPGPAVLGPDHHQLFFSNNQQESSTPSLSATDGKSNMSAISQFSATIDSIISTTASNEIPILPKGAVLVVAIDATTTAGTPFPTNVQNDQFIRPKQDDQQEVETIDKKTRVIKSFQEHFSELVKYKERHGHCNVVRRQCSLGTWCHNLRRSYKEIKGGRPRTRGNALTDERIKRLEALGFRWTSAKGFDERLEELAEFKETHGHCNVPILHSSLGRWCSDVRRAYKEMNKGLPQTTGPTLTPERVKSLNNLNFLWFKNKTFEERLKELIEYKKLHGHCTVPILHSSLGRWCGEVRRGYKTWQCMGKRTGGTKMTPKRIEQLKEIGFQFAL